MSDLAPFVAANLRDKVVQDLQKENAVLRAKMAEMAEKVAEKEEEKHEGLARDAVYGFDRLCRVAITGPVPPGYPAEGEVPHVYAVGNIYESGRMYYGDDFAAMNDCTLGDLLHAELFVNGNRGGRLSQFRHLLHFRLSLGGGRPDITSLDDVLVPDSDFDDRAGFTVFHDSVGVIGFDLRGVSKEKYFEAALLDCDEFLANPRSVSVPREMPIAELIAVFGGGDSSGFRLGRQ